MVWLALGTVAGLILLSSIGYGLGALMLVWFGGPFCCGGEAFFPLGVGTVGGAATGVAAGGLLGWNRPLARRAFSARGLVTLVVAWGGSLAVTWALGRTLHFDIEGTDDVFLFFGLVLVLPAMAWIAAAWVSQRRAFQGRS